MLRRSAGVWMAACLAAAVAVEGAQAPVADAVQALDRRALGALLEASADVNAAQVDGMTALHWAVRHDDPAVAELLLEAGADASVANRYGVTPLTIACINGSGPVVELLLDAGADPNTTLPGGETALMTASRTGRLAPVKALLVRGADPHATVLGMGRQEGAGANAFLRRMEDPTIFDFKLKSEQTALVWAASEGHAEVVAELIEFGADFRRKLESGFTPLLFAVRAGHLDVVKTLVDAGVDVKQRIEPSKEWRHRGYVARLRPNATALHVALENGHFGLAAYLLGAGADPNAADPVGYTPLHAITNARRVALGDANPPPRPTGGMTSLDLVRKLAAYGADLNASLTGAGLLNLGGAQE
ncbi:MAG: ankyrin repeat domain-containing protein [Bryobacterales bacterium]|nr:ankyrin repeat domain-containing protein [Bryobacterales bacterium]